MQYACYTDVVQDWSNEYSNDDMYEECIIMIACISDYEINMM